MASIRVLQDHFGIMLGAYQRFPLPQLWPMATIMSKRDLTGVVMSLDAFMLSRFTTLTPLNGEMLVETKLILFYVKQNT